MAKTQQKHTPGPWKLDEPGSNLVCYLGVPVAKSLDNCDTKEETEANARLIAAAPEMLESLNELRNYLHDLDADDFPEARKLTSKAYAVIAKAEGQS